MNVKTKVIKVTFDCPHCHIRQDAFVTFPRNSDKKIERVICSTTGENKGCLKEFDIHTQIQHYVTPTMEQVRILQNERINSSENQSGKRADRMGGA